MDKPLATEDRAPDEAFVIPGLHPGLQFGGPPVPLWRRRPHQTSTVVNCATDPGDRAAIDRSLERLAATLAAGPRVEFNAVPALLEQARFQRSLVSVGGRYLLSGPAGVRARTRYYLRDRSRHQAMAAFLNAQTREAAGGPVGWNASLPEGVDICLDARGFTNYYHFMAEVMTALATVADIAEGRRIRIHSPNPVISDTSFAMRFIGAFFGELAPAIDIVNDVRPADYERCIHPCLADHFFYMLPFDLLPAAEGQEELSGLLARDSATLTGYNRLRAQKFDGRLSLLRRQMLSQIVPGDTALPKKILLNRKPGGGSDRPAERWDEVCRDLLRQGFEEVFFEDHAPKAQIALVNNAKVVVALHGAGVTNMLFADPGTRFIEVGNLENTGGRLAVFSELAEAAGCDYRMLAADRTLPEYGSNGVKKLSRVRLTD
ncbi:MAG: glycosyltransferase 61 family protein, partial [Paracoccus sp. (in: a-proteobacteria)]